jgi:uracil phosphoribosyltransferase
VGRGYRKTRTVAVILDSGFNLQMIFLYAIAEMEDGKIGVDRLEKKSFQFPVRFPQDIIWKDVVILTDLFVHAGHIVRFYDYAEKEWMQTDAEKGNRVVRGMPDGAWVEPSVAEFKAHYLGG